MMSAALRMDFPCETVNMTAKQYSGSDSKIHA